MSVKKEGKITFLKHILEAKDTLFGAFSDKLTKEDKTKTWKAMHEKALALGIVPCNKDYIYTRDTYWQNLKKYTMVSLVLWMWNKDSLIIKTVMEPYTLF